MNPEKIDILEEFSDFSNSIMQLNLEQTAIKLKARINRVGVTNAADRGLDMWANFGLAIQIKHLSLTEELAENIVSSVSADRIVIVCKAAEQKIIVSLLNQLGWKSKIQSIVTENDLLGWYEKALSGKFADSIGDTVLQKLADEIQVEFPTTDKAGFLQFMEKRGYSKLASSYW
jgi:type II restriction enzyme